MRTWVSYMLVLLLMFPTLSKMAVITWFKSNQDWIAKELCINRNTKKADSCAGCCVLEDKLEKVNDEPLEESPPASKIQKEELSPFIQAELFACTSIPDLVETSFKAAESSVSEKHVELGLKPPTV
ncbi:MAG: hypothetical protein L6Q78_15360 [Bacteroidia bacterium]|nr:hypothetical protein [Bacteroidia bacterium]